MKYFRTSLFHKIFQTFGLRIHWSAINQTIAKSTPKQTKQANKASKYYTLHGHKLRIFKGLKLQC
jgi:hypothetical protein